MSGVEGYVESAASGLLAGLNAAALASGRAHGHAAAHDGDRRAGVLRVARQPGALRAVEHHVRHHAAAAQRAPKRRSSRASVAIAERALADLRNLDACTAHLKAFLQFLRLNRNASAHTVRAYESDLTQFLAHAAAPRASSGPALEPSHLDRTAIRGFLASCTSADSSRATAARKLAAARTFLRYLRREGLIDDDPGALVPTPKREVRMPAHLSEQEMAAPARRRRPRDGPLGAPRSRDPRAVLRVGPAPQRARRPRRRTT